MFRVFNQGRMRFDQNPIFPFSIRQAQHIIQRSLLVFVLLWGGNA